MALNHWSLAAGLAIAALSFGSGTARAESMRCKERLVSIGDAQYVVEQRCGPPDAVASRVERRKVTRTVAFPCVSGTCYAQVEDSVDVVVEEWTYDFGKNRFLQFVEFVSGKVVGIRSGSYGFKETTY
jgi:hypothetical protein